MTAQQLRPIVLALVAAIASFGWISPDLHAVIEANANAVIVGGLALWAIIAHRRNRKDAKAATTAAGKVVAP